MIAAASYPRSRHEVQRPAPGPAPGAVLGEVHASATNTSSPSRASMDSEAPVLYTCYFMFVAPAPPCNSAFSLSKFHANAWSITTVTAHSMANTAVSPAANHNTTSRLSVVKLSPMSRKAIIMRIML